GTGPVRPLIAMKGDLRHGIVVLAKSEIDGWLAFKTLWFSVPPYRGPFLVRATRLDGLGEIAFGETPTLASLVVPPGPTINSGAGYRTAPGATWVRAGMLQLASRRSDLQRGDRGPGRIARRDLTVKARTAY